MDSAASTGERASVADGELAAIDLGSNSFHMLVAQDDGGVIRRVDRLRERVALAEGLEPGGGLREDVAERSLKCLARFRQRIHDLPRARVRAVGTATFRQIKKDVEFLTRAEEELGVEIEILPGSEEARLIYSGVAHTVGDDVRRRLVVDIGGASTECIIGEKFSVLSGRSISMGCVRWSMEYFSGGKISRKQMAHAELAARLQLAPLEVSYCKLGWDGCTGSSGTILAVADILRSRGWSKGEITPRALDKLTEFLIERGHADELELEGLKPDRRPVIAGGVAILRAAFAGFELERMETTKGALREGLAHDLLGRIHEEDVRELSVRAMSERFDVDLDQAERVTQTALAMIDQAPGHWEVTPDHVRMVRWAARLHEVGLSVAWSGYHKHGAYLVENSDMSGFSRQEHELLAVLIRSHRRRVPEQVLRELGRKRRRIALRLMVILRLAVRLHRTRSTTPVPAPTLSAEDSSVQLGFPPGFLESHPLTMADFEEEISLMRPLGIDLTVVSGDLAE